MAEKKIQTGPEREKPIRGEQGPVSGKKLGGGPRDLSHSITSDGKVKKL